MRLLHVVPSYLPALRYGGPIHSVHGLCKALAGRGHEVEVFTTNVDGPADSDVALGVPVDRDGVKVSYFPVPVLRRLYWSPAMGEALRRRVKEFDLVHTHSVFLWPTSAAVRMARRQDVPYVVAPRGMLVRDLIGRRNRLLKQAWIALVERANVENASLVHFTSRIEAEDAAELGIAARRTCVVPNGVDMPDPGSGNAAELPGRTAGDAGPYLLCLGRINWKKGLDRLIAALAEIPECRLVIAGNDEEGLQPVLEAQSADAGLRGRVAFVGAVQGEAKAALLRHARMLVLPSHSENFGNVVLEAMAAGRPAVVTPEVGAADLVRESGAGAVLEGEPAVLAAGIRRLLSDPAALDRMGAQGRDFVRHRYSWDTVAAQMEEAYRQALGK